MYDSSRILAWLKHALGAAAKTLKIAQQLKASTRRARVMNLARIGDYFLKIYHCPLEDAFKALQALPNRTGEH